MLKSGREGAQTNAGKEISFRSGKIYDIKSVSLLRFGMEAVISYQFLSNSRFTLFCIMNMLNIPRKKESKHRRHRDPVI